MNQNPGMTYAGSGVDYSKLDSFKVVAQQLARLTAGNVKFAGVHPIETTRGESAYAVNIGGTYFGLVEEGLGTKNLVADAMYRLTKGERSYYDHVAQCTVAMIVNDLITVGLNPILLAMHLAVGSSAWMDDKERYIDLAEGWRKASDLARCIWAGGETPTLKDIISPDAAVLAGSAMGMCQKLIDPFSIEPGDAIIVLTSSGIHANGLTLAREIAAKLPDGYLTRMPCGRSYGDALLDPTHIYVGVVQDLLAADINIHYAVNITGHGWRKLMRYDKKWLGDPVPLVYVIDRLPDPQPVFTFIQKHGPVSAEEAYGNLNMGGGFALYVPEHQVEHTLALCEQGNYGFTAIRAGYIEKSTEKKVVLRPKGITFKADTLAVR